MRNGLRAPSASAFLDPPSRPARPRTGACGPWPPRFPRKRARLLVALGSLPERERIIVVARYWHDESVDALADRLGVTAQWVRALDRSALERMRSEIAPYVERGVVAVDY